MFYIILILKQDLMQFSFILINLSIKHISLFWELEVLH